MPPRAVPDASARPVQTGRAAFSHFQYIYTIPRPMAPLGTASGVENAYPS